METSFVHFLWHCLLVLRTPFGQSPPLATFELDFLLHVHGACWVLVRSCSWTKSVRGSGLPDSRNPTKF